MRAELLGGSTVVVLMGGRSTEREVSLVSGRAVADALSVVPPDSERPGPERVIAVEIDRAGRWLVEGEHLEPAAALARLPANAIFFLGLHGSPGEDGSMQGFLETAGRAYTGSGVLASALCINKHATRLVLAAAGVRVARGMQIDAKRWREERGAALAQLDELVEGDRHGAGGWSVKPNCGGSSISTFLVSKRDELAVAIDAVLATGDRALVEAWVRGTEVTCGVLGNGDGEQRALPPVEIVPKDDRFFDYEQKYSAQGADEFCPPRSLAPELVERVQALAVRAHRAAGCDGYSRTDFIVPDPGDGLPARGAGGTDRDREPVALEINTLPGMTQRSLLPKAAAVEGLSLRELCLEILGLALARKPGDGGAAAS
ncbi:MAG: D-alanine--D-alanine ligase [Planctomycetota bacterium]